MTQHHSFTLLHLSRSQQGPENESSSIELSTEGYEQSHEDTLTKQQFAAAEELLNFVTKRWNERWVTTNIWNEETLQIFSRRPFFFLVSVDAPINLRWERCKER